MRKNLKYSLLFFGLLILLIIILGIFFVDRVSWSAKPQADDTRTYTQILLDESPRQALFELQSDIAWNKEVANNCHPIAHELGQFAFDKYKSYEEAIKYQQSVCNSGYIHGVLEKRLSNVQNISEEISSLCKGEFSSSYNEWQCFHGIGHGIMYYTNNNLPLSLQYCKSLPNLSDQGSCANGIYMENFVSENNLHPSSFVKDSDPFYPCNDSTFPFSSDCLYYAPTRMLQQNNNNYLEVYKKCNDLSQEQKNICVAGLSGQATKNNFINLLEVEKICNTFSSDDQENCIRSMVSMYINMQGTSIGYENICANLHSKYKIACESEYKNKQQELAYQ